MGNGIESVEVSVISLRHAAEELDDGAQLLTALSRRCCDVAAEAEDWKEDIKDLHPETFERVREVIDFLFELDITLKFVGRDIYKKAISAGCLTETKGRLKAA